jgi:hypothetical protein
MAVKGRAKRWREFTERLQGRLTAEQIASLNRARAGSPPGFLLGWYTETGAEHALDEPLRIVEGIARELLRGYDWPDAAEGEEWPASGYREDLGRGRWRPVGPDWSPDVNRGRLEHNEGRDRVCLGYTDKGVPRGGPPDLRGEMLHLVLLAAEVRAAVAGGYIESAVLRAMTVGSLFTRIASMLIDAGDMAEGAIIRNTRKPTGPSKKRNAADWWAERLPIIDQIERSIGPQVKGKERWRHVAVKYKESECETLPVSAAQKRLGPYRKNPAI